jgi:hypothetical protein
MVAERCGTERKKREGHSQPVSQPGSALKDEIPVGRHEKNVYINTGGVVFQHQKLYYQHQGYTKGSSSTHRSTTIGMCARPIHTTRQQSSKLKRCCGVRKHHNPKPLQLVMHVLRLDNKKMFRVGHAIVFFGSKLLYAENGYPKRNIFLKCSWE